MTLEELQLPGHGVKPDEVCDCCEHEHDDPLIETRIREIDHNERSDSELTVRLCAECLGVATMLSPARLNRIYQPSCEWWVL